MNISNEFKAGLAIVIAVVVFALGIRFLRDLPLFRGSYELHTEFRESQGLSAGNPVLINGVRVGEVTRVTLDPQLQNVEATIQLSNSVRVPKGSTIKQTGVSALGGVKAVIIPGSADNPPLEPGDHIPSRQEKGLIGTVSEQALTLLSQTDTLLTEVNRTLQRVQTRLGRPESHLNQSLRNLARVSGALDTLVRRDNRQIHQILEHTRAVTANLEEFTSSQQDSLAATIQHANRSLQKMNGTMAEIDSMTGSINEFATNVNQGKGTLGKLANDPSLYYRLDSAATSINSLTGDFQENPKKYLRHLKLFSLF